MLRTTVLVLTLLLLLVPRVEAGLDEDVAALGEAAAKKLDELATWCTKKRVFGSRDDAYAALLAFEPQHRDARKRLKYKQGDDGAWQQDPKYKRAKNWNKAAAKEAAEKLAAILGEHTAAERARYATAETIPDLLSARRRVDALVRAEPANEDNAKLLRSLTMRYYEIVQERGLVKEMEDAAKELRDHHPEDIAIRHLLGEVEHAGTWVLLESARTLNSESGLAKAVQKGTQDVPTKAATPSPKETKIELPWADGAATTDIRIMGTQKAEVLADVARRAQAAGAFFELALGKKPVRRGDLTAYLFAKKGELDTFLDAYPTVDNPTLKFRGKLDLVYASGYAIALKDNPPRAQTDLVVNEILNMMIADTFLKSEAPKGWHAEGISRYLAWKLTGTRLSIAVSGKYAGQGGDRHVPESGDPWLLKARAHLQKGAGLQLLLGKGTDVFSVRDSMIAYAFAIYLIEGHDQVAARFVAVHTKTADVDRACREVLGMPRTVAEARLARWLDEVTFSERAAAARKAAAKAKKKPAPKKKKK